MTRKQLTVPTTYPTTFVSEEIARKRLEQGLSLAEISRQLDELKNQGKTSTTIDPAGLSRLENGTTQKANEDRLRALAMAMKLKDEDYFIEFATECTEIPLKIGAVHNLFAAPVFAALPHFDLFGSTLSSFGNEDENGKYVPTSNPISPRQRENLITRNGPTYYADYMRTQGYLERVSSFPEARAVTSQPKVSPQVNVLCAGKEIEELWENNEINVAIAAKEVFKDQLRKNEAVTCGTISYTEHGASLVFLINPAIYEKNIGLEKVEKKISEYKDNVGNIFKSFQKLRHKEIKALPVKVFLPEKTFAGKLINELKPYASSEWGAFDQHPLDFGNYEAARDEIFEAALNNEGNGFAVVAIWEPFKTYLRYGWEAKLREEFGNEHPGIKSFQIASPQTYSRGQILNPKELSCSLEWSIGRIFNHLGAPSVPTVSMDVMIKQNALFRMSRTPNRLINGFFGGIESAIAGLREAANKYTEMLPLSTDETVGKIIDLAANEHIRNISSYFEIPRSRCLNAVAEADYRLTYDQAFIQHLIKD